MEALDKTVDRRKLPTGYHTSSPPTPSSCDKCERDLGSLNVNVLICGHVYHHEYYQSWENRCKRCEEYYKKGILTNVKSFLERLNKGGDILTSEDIDEESHEEEGQEEDIIMPETNLNIDLNKKIKLVSGCKYYL